MEQNNSAQPDIKKNKGPIARYIQMINDTHFRTLGLEKGQFIFLTRIYENKGITQIRLSCLLHVDKGTTAKAVRKMEEKNLIIRQRDQSDRRILHLYPTDRGCLLYHLILKEENRNIALFWGRNSAGRPKNCRTCLDQLYCKNNFIPDISLRHFPIMYKEGFSL